MTWLDAIRAHFRGYGEMWSDLNGIRDWWQLRHYHIQDDRYITAWPESHPNEIRLCGRFTRDELIAIGRAAAAGGEGERNDG